MSDLSHLTDEHIKEEILLTSRQLLINSAYENMSDFCKMMMPDPEDPDDVTRTIYQSAGHSKMLCDIVENIESGKTNRCAVAIPPQHGKTIHLSQVGLAWIWGRNPRANIVVVTYNQTRADELGHEFRQMIKDRPMYQQVFPELEFVKEAKSKSMMQNTKGGKVFFIGVGGTITGRTADYIIIDDPYKGDDDEFTSTHLEKIWNWFYKVAYSRGSNKTRICVIHTRWHEDDLIGRLCDESHPERNKRYDGIADDWVHMNIPGVIKSKRLAKALGLTLRVQKDPKIVAQFGTEPMTALWPKEKSLSFFAQWKKGSPRTFSALVMGSPAPDDGVYFTEDMIVEYGPNDLPEDLRHYGASDHATGQNEENDFTVIGCAAIDENDDIWILPDLFMERVETDVTVEEIINQMRTHKPSIWWMESELISKSFGPFLRKRMIETRTYTVLDPVTPTKDKKRRARSIQGRMSMKKVHFPRFAPWWLTAKNQLLKFPYGANDDFVDWLAYIGLGLVKELSASPTRPKLSDIPRTGTGAWVKFAGKQAARRQRIERQTKGW